ncbi:hypothetical protein [Bordetella pertussis]|uniref:hypothetical protein n=1 Tax=Bordetella pertussis TaxID=520 RepID=UPI00366EC204
MPLPKLPNRPAAILTFPSGDTARAKAARTNSKPAVAGNTDEPLLQPELAGLANSQLRCVSTSSMRRRISRS